MRIALRLLAVLLAGIGLAASSAGIAAKRKIADVERSFREDMATDISVPARSDLQTFSGVLQSSWSYKKTTNEGTESIAHWRWQWKWQSQQFIVQAVPAGGSAKDLMLSGLDADAQVAKVIEGQFAGKEVTALIDNAGRVFELSVGSTKLIDFESAIERRKQARDNGPMPPRHAGTAILGLIGAGVLALLGGLLLWRRSGRL